LNGKRREKLRLGEEIPREQRIARMTEGGIVLYSKA